MLIFIFIFVLTFSSCIFTANQTVGSDSSVGFPQSHVTFDGWDNRIANYALMQNGFSMRDNESDLNYDSVFPVSGSVRLRGGEMHLDKDFRFSDVGKLSTSAVIAGNNRNFIISKGISNLSSLLSLSYITNINVNGDVEGIAWSLSDSGYIAVANTGASGAIRIYYFDGSSLIYKVDRLTSYDSTAIRWKPASGSYFASNLSYYNSLYNYVLLWSYTIATNSLIWNNYRSFGTEIVDAISWYTDGTAIAIARRNNSQRITVWEVNASNQFTGTYITNIANSNVPTAVDISNDAIDFDSTGEYLAVGFKNTGDSLHEFVIYQFDKQASFSSSSLTYATGINIGGDVTHLDWSPTGEFIAVAVSLSTENYINCYKYYSNTNSLEKLSGVSVKSSSTINSVKWSHDGNYLVVSRDSGSDSEFNVYFFDKERELFYLVDEYEIGSNVMGVNFSPDRVYLAQGGSDQTLNIYNFLADQSYFYFDNVNIILDGDFLINVPLKFRGNCSIFGNGNKLEIGSIGNVVVDSSASLKIENLKLSGVKTNSFSCLDNSSKVSFRDVELELSGDWVFDNGAILFTSDCLVTGTNSLVYRSTITSTIDSNSVLELSNGSSFKYEPVSSNRNLIYLNDKSSYIYLNGSTLVSTSTGLVLTNGTLLLDNDVTFSSHGNYLSEAICFGNGNLENDLNINILSSADIKFYGPVSYENVE